LGLYVYYTPKRLILQCFLAYKWELTEYWAAVHSVHSNTLCDAQKDEPSCDKHKKVRLSVQT